jgi:hypothetical protein
MNIFNPYFDVIKKAIDSDPKSQQRMYGSQIDESQFDMSYVKNLSNQYPGVQQVNDTILLKKGFSSQDITPIPQLGNHPDFQHLRGTDNSEDHWIISGFIDLKESTKLFNRFTKATVSLITEGIVKASIFAVNYCGGYVQRIQGDGLMVYFGGKNIEKKTATEDALKAFAMISYFVKNDLRVYFEENNISEIYTRGGLDLGHSNQVRWIYSGIGNAGEITTCSLHTSLAPKMQAKASSNGIVVGQNIVNQLQQNNYFTSKKNPIWDYEDGRVYNHFDFNWEKYLVQTGVAVQDRFGAIILSLNFSRDQKQDFESLKPIAAQNKPYLSSNE